MKALIILIAAFGAVSCSTTKKSSGYSGFGIESISKEKLAAYAPPPANPELKSVIEKLVDIRSPGTGLITDNGKTLFTTWNVTGSNQIWKLSGAKSFPVQLTGGEDRSNLRSISPDNQWIAFTRDSKGDENFGVYLMRTNGNSVSKVYYNPKQQADFLGFSDDSQFVFYNTNDKSPSSNSIYRYNIKSGQHEIIVDEPGLWELSDIQGDEAILSLNKGSMNNEHYLLNLKTKAKQPLIGQNESEDYRVLFSKNKGEYLVLTNKPADFRRIYLLKNGKLSPYSPELKADVSDMILSENRRILAYTINNKGFSEVKLTEFATKKPITLPKLDGAMQVSLGGFSRNNRYVTLSTQTYNAPSLSYVFDLQTRRLTEWVVPSSPEIETKGFVKPSLEYYKATDGTDIPMFVWRSEKCKKEVCPVIISFHGGPESQFVPRFAPSYNLYTEKGFVFVAPNVRGSDGYGKKWLHADDGVKRLSVITDIRDAADFIRKNWAKNGKAPKIGITGGSYGGYSTLVGSSMFADSYDAGVAIVGMSSLITFIENTAPYRRALRMNEYGDPAKDREAMLKLSPISYINKVTKPLMILHGASDPRVPVGEAVQFFETVKSQNANDRLVIFPDEGHGVAKRPNIVLATSYILDFFEKHLK
jgi:dipeptidyl aminopeptidase/acylaminoacyl peptidase